MCARQQGDLCDYKDKCDEVKGLYCDFQFGDSGRGLCRGRATLTSNAKDNNNFRFILAYDL